VLRSDLAVLDQNIGSSFDQLIQGAMVVQKSHHEVVNQQQGRSADNPACYRIVVADDGVLHGVGQRQQDHQVKRIELNQFPFSGEPQADDQKPVHHNGPKNFLCNWQC
jgi:hypothetical protein